MKAKKIFALILVAIMAAIVAGSSVGLAQETPCDTVVVLPENIYPSSALTPTSTPLPQGSFVKFTRAGGNASISVGPETPPLGIGSLTLQTPGSPAPASDKVYLFNYDHRGTPLSEIDAISYSTYRFENSTANPIQTTALNIEIDYNGAAPGGYAVLVYEPHYNAVLEGPVVEGEWQDWDAYADGNAIWWSSKPINGVCDFNCFVTWDTIVALNPDAVILGGFGVNQGGGNDGLFAAVDALKLGYGDDCVTYDFEPYRVATTKDACKAGGWQSVKRADGSSFKNQGDCVSYVSNGK